MRLVSVSWDAPTSDNIRLNHIGLEDIILDKGYNIDVRGHNIVSKAIILDQMSKYWIRGHNIGSDAIILREKDIIVDQRP